MSKKLIGDSDRRLQLGLLSIAALIAILAVVVTPVTEGGVGLPFAAKVLISVLMIAPPAFVMGMPFPTGLGRVEKVMPASVRWAWSINAASSVLGSAAAIFLAIYLGLRITLLIGGALYLAALLTASNSPLMRSRATLR